MKQLLLLLLLTGLSATAQYQDTIVAEVPADLLFKKNFHSEFSISPDGKFFAEVLRVRDNRDIAIVNIGGRKLVHRIPMGERPITNLVWLSDRRLMFQTLGSIFAIDLDGGNEFQLASMIKENASLDYYSLKKNLVFNNILALLPDVDDEILIETFDHNGFASIKRVNVFTGEKIEVLNGSYYDIQGWYVNRDGDPILGIRKDDTKYEFCTLNPETNTWDPLWLNLNGEKVLFRIEPMSFLERNVHLEGVGYGKYIYLSTNINSDKRVLIAYDLGENRIKEELVNDINVDVSDAEGEDLSLIFDHKNRKLAGVRYEGLTPQHRWYSKEFKSAFDLMSAQNPSLVNDILRADLKNKRFLIHQWSDVYAGNIGVFDLRDSVYSVMVQKNEDLNAYKLDKVRNRNFRNREGTVLPSYMQLPKDYNPDMKYPLVVIPHGGPWARDYWGLDGFSQYFSTRGYIVLRVNYRGSFGFGRDYAQAGFNGISTVMIDDIADATRAVVESFPIEAGRVHIFGHSYGGYAAYVSLARYQELYASAVAVSAPTDLADWMKYQRKNDFDFSYTFWKHALGTRSKKDLEALSPLFMVEQIDRPVLVFHGEYDRIIPVSQAEAIEKEFDKSQKNATVRILKRQGHSIQDGNSIGYVLDEALEFFEENRGE